jgi:hypothetical protein
MMTPSFAARDIAPNNKPGVRRSHTEAHGALPLVPSGQRAATDAFPVPGRTRVQKPAPLSDFEVPQLVLSFNRVIPSDPSLLDQAVDEITAAVDRTGCCDDVETIGLVVREALANAMIHGNHCDPEKTVGVSVAVSVDADLLIIVKDSGSGSIQAGFRIRLLTRTSRPITVEASCL